MGLFFTSLTLVDSMTLYGAVPAVIGFGLLATCTYLQALGLQVPLWFSKQIYRYLILSIGVFLFMGYITLKRDMHMNEKRQVLGNIQT